MAAHCKYRIVLTTEIDITYLTNINIQTQLLSEVIKKRDEGRFP